MSKLKADQGFVRNKKLFSYPMMLRYLLLLLGSFDNGNAYGIYDNVIASA